MKATDWTKWSAIAEILSAVAILITLLYLAMQTRYLAVQTEQNTQATQAAAAQGLLEREMAATDQLVIYPEILELMFAKRELTTGEAARLYAFLTGFARSRESFFRQQVLGVIDEITYQRMEGPFLYILTMERVNNFWLNQRQAYDSGFVERIDSRLAGQEITQGNEDFLQDVFGRPE